MTESAWDDDPHILKPNETTKSTLEYLSIATDYISVPLCVLVILADILLIVVILKHRRLKTRNNYYVMYFAVFHILYIISTPCFYIILDIFYGGFLDVHWFCVWIRIENFGIGLTLTFVVGFGLDTFLEAKQVSWFGKYKERYFYVFLLFYFFHFLIYIISACICLKKGLANNFNFYFLTLYYVLVLMIGLYIRCASCSKLLPIEVSFIVLLSWLPLFIWYNLINIFRDVPDIKIVLRYTAFLPEYLAYCCSVMVVWKLWKSNKHYKVAFRKFFRRPVSNVDYDELNANDNGPVDKL